MLGGGENSRQQIRIKLYCPKSSSSSAALVVWEDDKVDLGSIALTFGMDPWTVKLNGHFISRGVVDLVSPSLTWKSLLSFFSARGLSTQPLIVHGKLAKAGTKRGRGDVENGMLEGGGGVKEEEQLEQITNLLQRNKLREEDAKSLLYDPHPPPLGLKRKHWLQDLSPVKKFRGTQGRGNGLNFQTGTCIIQHVKRSREDDIVVPHPPFKRTTI